MKDVEILSRLLDGELAEPERRDIERRLGEDAALASLATELHRNDAAVRRAFELDAAVPLDAAATIRQGFAQRRREQARRDRLRAWLPIAASVLVVAGAALWFERKLASVEAENRLAMARLVDTAVQNALETAVSGSEVALGIGSADIRIVPTRTYRSESNHWCREFRETVLADGVREIREGTACREREGGWRIVRASDT